MKGASLGLAVLAVLATAAAVLSRPALQVAPGAPPVVEVLGDPEYALLVGGMDGRPVRHLGIVGFTPENLSQDDVVTANLEIINMSTVGILDVDLADGVTAEPLIVSSDQAGSLDAIQFQFLQNPEELLAGFSPLGESLIAAVRLSGKGKSAFPDGPPEGIEADDPAG